MLLLAVFTLSVFAQQPQALAPDIVSQGRVTDLDAQVKTPTLDQDFKSAKTVGVLLEVTLKESGPYFLDLRSHDFDSYLVLRDEAGNLLAEDDDGGIGPHSRIVWNFEASRKYEVWACALHGARGEFEIQLRKGEPQPLTAEELEAADIDDAKDRLRLMKSRFAQNSLEVASAMDHLGFIYWRHRRFLQALTQMEESLQIIREIFGEDHVRTAKAKFQVAAQLLALSRPEEALKYHQEAYQVQKKELGMAHPDTFNSLYGIVYLLDWLNRESEAIGLARDLLQVSIELYGEGHWQTANADLALGNILRGLGDLDEAEKCYRAAISINLEVFGESHQNTANSYSYLANLLIDQGKLEEALDVLERQLAVLEPLFGLQSHWVREALSQIAGIHLSKNNFVLAEQTYRQALAISEAVDPPGSIGATVDQVKLSEALGSQGRFLEALALAEHAISVRGKLIGEENPEIATYLDIQSLILLKANQFDNALRVAQRALSIAEKAFGEGDARTARYLKTVGQVYFDLDQAELALSYFERCSGIYLTVFGEPNRQLNGLKSSISLVHSRRGDFRTARRLAEEALEFNLNYYGEDSSQAEITRAKLANILYEMGELDQARVQFENCLIAFERLHGPDHIQSCSTLNYLGLLLVDQAEYDKAEEAFQRALRILLKTYGEAHPEVGSVQNNLGNLLMAQGRLDQAIELYQQSLDVTRAGLGEGAKWTAYSAYNLAKCLVKVGRHEEARPHFESAIDTVLQILDTELPTMNEAARLQLLAKEFHPQAYFSSLVGRGDVDLASSINYHFRWKGKATRLQKASLEFARETDNDKLQGMRFSLQKLNTELSSMVLVPLGNQQADYALRLESLRGQRLELEREINRAMGLDLTLATPDCQQVQGALPQNTVLVDFFVRGRVFAWVLGATGAPQLIDLGLSDQIRAAQTKFLRMSARRGGRAMEGPKDGDETSLYDMLWAPLQAAVGDAKTVIVSPSGFLCKFPFGILQKPDGEFLLEQYNFVYLSDGTQVVAFDDASVERKGGMLAVGDINYFRRDEADGVSADGYSSRSRIGSSWSSLAATRVELQAIEDLYQYGLEWESGFKKVVGKAATEERVRSELAGFRYVHLATHGYFEPEHLPSLQAMAEKSKGVASLSGQQVVAGLLPGLMSGLVFAGVNAEPDPNRDDGYLSAEEIQFLDLSACDLAVLSACETALGSERGGEGLMSLRRAFEVAGAKTVVSSLWKVDDQATAELMKWFYENYLQKNMSKSQALRAARLRMLAQNRADFNGDAMPNTWGAFVMSGDWR